MILLLSSVISLVLISYFLNFVFLAYLALRKTLSHRKVKIDQYPTVSIHLPIYNEYYVAERLIDSVCRIDYPRDKLQIIIIDDSDDETVNIVSRTVEKNRERGIDIVHLRREGRKGFKAGALQEALKISKGEFIAIFDADFVPPPDFLKKLLPYFSSKDVGLVQAKWEHLNAESSSLTMGQALALNLHFKIEQFAKNSHGFFINFNGTSGVWRKECIESVGGWEECLAEDLNLSYRAQLMGWRLIYVDEIGCPAELPVQIQAAKRQQYRWTYGSIEVLKKYAWRIIRAKLPPSVKLQALLHLTRHLPQVLMLLQVILTPFIVLEAPAGQASSAFWMGFTFLVFLYATLVTERTSHQLSYLPHFILFSTGMMVNNSIAFFKALLNRSESFFRTPKLGIVSKDVNWKLKKYVLPFDEVSLAELAVALYSSTIALLAFLKFSLGYVPYLLLISASMFYSSIHSFAHAKRSRRGEGRLIRLLKIIIVAMIAIAMVFPIVGYTNTYYVLDRAAGYLDRARATADLDMMKNYLSNAFELIPSSGNPVWIFPTSRTDFALIKRDMQTLFKRIELLKKIDPSSDAYQQGIDDLRGRINVISLNLKEAAPFYFVSPLSVALSIAWLIAFIYVLILYGRFKRLEAIREKAR